MAVSDWEELGESPRYNVKRDMATAVRKFKIPWADIDLFVATVFPLSSSGIGSPASINGKAWFISEEIDIEPFDDPTPGATEDPATYRFATATVKYSTNPDGVGTQSANPVETSGDPDATGQNKGDGSGPGGEKGSANEKFLEWISHELSFGGEVITLPNHGIYFAGDDPGKGVHGVNAGIILPTVEHRIKLKRVTTPPFDSIRAAIGKIGGGMGAVSGTVMFLGCEAHDARDGKTGQTIWDLTYHFSERSVDWRFFYDPATGDFRQILKKNGQPIFVGAGVDGGDNDAAWDTLYAELNQI